MGPWPKSTSSPSGDAILCEFWVSTGGPGLLVGQIGHLGPPLAIFWWSRAGPKPKSIPKLSRDAILSEVWVSTGGPAGCSSGKLAIWGHHWPYSGGPMLDQTRKVLQNRAGMRFCAFAGVRRSSPEFAGGVLKSCPGISFSIIFRSFF